jgi:glycosyltransferase involved in cell wall biosynthesis
MRLVCILRLLFLTLSNIQSMTERGIYTDLLREFRDRGHDVCVVCPSERRFGAPTELVARDGATILRVRTGNITKTGFFEKTVSTALLEFQFVSAIRKFLSNVKFDLVLYSTPPITLDRVVRFVKGRDHCRSYLLLKDITPQDLVDMGIIRQGGLIWRYLRQREKRLYSLSDYIGCMSAANVKYLLKNNDDIPPARVEECPNSISPRPARDFERSCRSLRGSYGIPDDSVLLVYGGNLGKAQGLAFLLDILDETRSRRGIYVLIAGSGTEYGRIQEHLTSGKHQNVRLISSLPKAEYDDLLAECDVGLIFLDPRFTIPNFPSRLTAYMEASLPVIAATDPNTDIKDVLRDSGSGYWVLNGDLGGFMAAVDQLAADATLRREMGHKGRAHLEKHYTASRAYETIMSHFIDQP